MTGERKERTMDVKGVELAQLVKFVKSRLGDEGHGLWLESLPAETRTYFSRAIMQSMWYPVEGAYLPAFDRAIDLVSPDDRNAGGRDFGEFSGRDELGGIYRVFLKMGSPNKMVSIASLMWGKFYNRGSFEVVDNEPGVARLRCVGVPPMGEPWEHSTAGWSEVALEMSGGKDPHVVIERSATRGDEYTQFLGTWS